MSIAIRRIHSKYLGDKAFPKDITEFEIREFFTLSARICERSESIAIRDRALRSPRGSVCGCCGAGETRCGRQPRSVIVS